MIESIRNDEQSLLVLDSGKVFPDRPQDQGYKSVLVLDSGAAFHDRPQDQEYQAETMLKAMEFMGYDVLNIGTPEFRFGKDFLKDTRSYTSFPYVASNLLYDGKKLPWTEEYIIKDINGLKIAIIGLINPDTLTESPGLEYLKNLDAIPAQIALQRLLPEIRAKADIVILLSLLGLEQTQALLKKVEGIDVAISSADKRWYPPSVCPEPNILQTGTGGRALGYARITLNDKGVVSVEDAKLITLDETMPDDAGIKDIIQAAFKANWHGQANVKSEKQAQEEIEELMEGLKQSPREFLEQYPDKLQIEKPGGME